MIWNQSGSLSKESKLTEVGMVVATLKFSGILGREALGTYNGTKLRFVHKGVLKSTVKVFSSDLENQLATIRLKWRFSEKAVIEMANGSVMRLVSRGVLSRTWSLKDEQGRELCQLVEKWGFLRSKGTFRSDMTAGHPQIIFLALLMWYIVMIISYQESGAGIGAGGG
jgi:hypothetical protein